MSMCDVLATTVGHSRLRTYNWPQATMRVGPVDRVSVGTFPITG